MPFSVLVADDEPNVRTLLVRILEASGYKVVSVADGRAALQSLTVKDFDLIICDQCMPHATGEQVAIVANKTKPNTKVILLTGNPDPSSPLPSGVHMILAKPVTVTVLRRAVEQFAN